jgi:hypothetical protein
MKVRHGCKNKEEHEWWRQIKERQRKSKDEKHGAAGSGEREAGDSTGSANEEKDKENQGEEGCVREGILYLKRGQHSFFDKSHA